MNGLPLNFATVPTANLELLKERLAPLTRILAQRLATTVRIRVPKSYDEVLDGMLLGTWDLVVVGPELWLSSVDRNAGYEALVRPIRGGLDAYRAAVFVRKDSGIRRLDQLARRRVSFVNPSSTAGYVAPRAALARSGVSLQALGGHSFAGSHENAINVVLTGRAEAGCSFAGALKTFGHDNPALARELEVLWESTPIPNEVYAVSPTWRGGDPKARAELRQVLTNLHETPQGRAALEAMHDRVDRFAAVDGQVYEDARPMLRRT